MVPGAPGPAASDSLEADHDVGVGGFAAVFIGCDFEAGVVFAPGEPLADVDASVGFQVQFVTGGVERQSRLDANFVASMIEADA